MGLRGRCLWLNAGVWLRRYVCREPVTGHIVEKGQQRGKTPDCCTTDGDVYFLSTMRA